MNEKVEILGILVSKPNTDIQTLQHVLTSYGCNIRTRLGLNSSDSNDKSLIIVELIGDLQECENFKSKLNSIPGIEIKNVSL